jgi:hypothetical protein
MYPFFEGHLLADVNNRTMKEFVERISGLSPATIRDYANIVKGVVASAINEDGEEVFPRTWNEEFIDAPIIRRQRQPSTTAEGMRGILEMAGGQYQVLYALLAGCGPLRAGEPSALTSKTLTAMGALFESVRRQNEECFNHILKRLTENAR